MYIGVCVYVIPVFQTHFYCALSMCGGEGMATHSSILAWRIPWTGDPGGLQSMGS